MWRRTFADRTRMRNDDLTRHGRKPQEQVLEVVDSRRASRFLVGGPLVCNLGKLVNLSERGALVMLRTAPSSNLIHFSVGDGKSSIACQATIVRTRRVGANRHSCAVSFPKLNDIDTATLTRLIARYGLGVDVQRREAA